MICHISRAERYRSPFGAVQPGQEIRLSCEADGEAVLHLWSDKWEKRLPALWEDGLYTVRFTPEEPGVLWYAFESRGERGDTHQITVYRFAPAPDWYKNAICYQIFPDRFYRGENWQFQQPGKRKGSHRFTLPQWDTAVFYPKDERGAVSAWPFWGGTLRGIQEKLPYLRSLGVGCLYLNPIFEASSNHRYDTADFFKVDPMLGSTEDFVALCDAAHAQGIGIILDGVFNHVGADSRYFDKFGNYGTAEDYRHWFRFGEQYRHGYECWWDVPDLPNVEEMDESYVEFICGENGVLRHWLRLGADGWRLDVADELPDAFIRAIRAAVKAEKSDAVLMGEVWEDATNKISYGERRMYFQRDELDCTMHYPFRDIALDFLLWRCNAHEAAARLQLLQEHYPPENYYAALNLAGSHDRERSLTVFGGDIQRMKLLSVMQYACPGVPCIYYGDEAGMTGGPDPYNRGAFPWGQENTELLNHYKKLAGLYENHPALRLGGFEPAARGDDVLCLTRWDENERLSVIIDRQSGKWSIEF